MADGYFGYNTYFTAPKAVIRQSIVWTAGFSNYTTSIVFILLYGLFVRNLFIEDGKKHSNVWAIPMLILGFFDNTYCRTRNNTCSYNGSIYYCI